LLAIFATGGLALAITGVVLAVGMASAGMSIHRAYGQNKAENLKARAKQLAKEFEKAMDEDLLPQDRRDLSEGDIENIERTLRAQANLKVGDKKKAVGADCAKLATTHLCLRILVHQCLTSPDGNDIEAYLKEMAGNEVRYMGKLVDAYRNAVGRGDDQQAIKESLTDLLADRILS
jgi:hypothetical protein